MRSNAWPERALAVIAACSLEAGWITLLYVLVSAIATHGPGPLSLPIFAVAALVGLIVSRWIGTEPRDRDRTLLAAVAIGLAIAGWLAPLGLDAGRVVAEPYALLQAHGGGLLVGLAVLRGSAHMTVQDDERIAELALGPGVLLVAATWLALSVAGATSVPAILADAFAATITYVTAALLSMGLVRITGLQAAGQVPAGRPAWVGLLVAVIAGLLVVAIPLALVIGTPVDAAVRGVLGPLAVIVVPLVAVLILPGALIGTALVALIDWLRGGPGSGAGSEIRVPGTLGPDLGNAIGPSGAQAVILGLVPLVVAIVVAFLVVRTLLNRTRRAGVDQDVVEVREIEPPTGGIRLRRPPRPRPRRSRDPRTASEAYLASLELLATSPDATRRPDETPGEHARRIASDPVWTPLRRLAVDYTLAEFGQRVLTSAEHRRALESWRRLRSAAVARQGKP
jgi:uncharacterized protein DUF4129